MSSVQDRPGPATSVAGQGAIDLKLEVVVIPVSDVDRAKDFYTRLGWRLDADFADEEGFRIVQLTPHGSDCSIQFGSKVTSAPPASATTKAPPSGAAEQPNLMYLVVSDVQAARDAIAALGVAVSEVFHERSIGDRFNPDARVAGAAPDGATYGSFASFSDPDGNTWLLQQITARLPGRVGPAATSFASASELSVALRRAAAAHGEHEARIGREDPDWPDWYAEYMVREQAGQELPS